MKLTQVLTRPAVLGALSGLVTAGVVIAAFWAYHAGNNSGAGTGQTTAPEAGAVTAPSTSSPSSSSGLPAPKLLVIDRQAILIRSAAGQAILKQVQGYQQQAEGELKGQVDSVRAQYADFQKQAALLSQQVKEDKMRSLEAQRAALEGKAKEKQSLIQGGMLQAREQLGNALGPILKSIMQERGANMLVDKGAIIYSTIDIDVTQIAIQRLNQTLPTVKVNLTPLPPGLQMQQQ
jgi:Skp family chaperone for outer membrane proteins